jgi:hypothetical protein
MSREQDDTNAFFDQLLGKLPTDGRAPHPGVAELRDALLAQIETQRSAETATAADFDQHELERMAEIKQLLIDQGLLGTTKMNTSSRSVDRPNLLQRLSEALLGDGWHRPVALAASLILCIVVIVTLTLPPPTDEILLRGADSPVMIAPDPAAAAESLAAQLRNAGAKVLVVPINAKEWSVRIDVPQAVELAAIQKILSDSGVQVVGPPPYHLSVKPGR